MRDDRALAADDLAAFAPRARSRIGFEMLSENPFYRFERRVHAAVEEARAHPDRRETERERVLRAEIRRIVRDGAISIVFQPVVRLDSREVVGVEAFARGPLETAFEAPRALFAAGDRFGAATDLDRVCRETALSTADLDRVPGRIFVNTRPECLAEPLRLGPSASLSSSRIVIELSMFVLSAFGGIGGRSGHSMWWGILILPYPVGWLMALAGAISTLIRFFKARARRAQS